MSTSWFEMIRLIDLGRVDVVPRIQVCDCAAPTGGFAWSSEAGVANCAAVTTRTARSAAQTARPTTATAWLDARE